MDDQASTVTPETTRPVFEALLYPRRSLGRRGYLILTIGTAAIIGGYALVFLLMGAWPIFGFLGGEWFLFWYLFTHHHRGNARSERIRLYADHLVFERRDAKGAVVVERLQPYWLNVILERPDEPDNALYLRSHGRSIRVGDFLSPDERRDLARELRQVLDRHRRPAFS
jgi:uncharacterized membrane protein